MVAVLTGCAQVSPQHQAYLAGQPLVLMTKQLAPGRGGFDPEDVTRCRIEAAQTVPASPVTVPVPGYSSPTQTSCSRVGSYVSCGTTGGDTLGGGTAVLDANGDLRASAVKLCMTRLGYQDYSIPACPPTAEVPLQGAPGSRTVCYVADRSGNTAFGAF